MTLSTLFLILISPLVALSSSYKTMSNPPPNQSFHPQIEPTKVFTSHPHATGPKSLSNKNTEKGGKNQRVQNQPETLGPLLHSKVAFKLIGDKKTRSLNSMQLAAQSKEFATYLHFEGEEGIEGKDIEDKEVIGIPNMENDLEELEERTEKLSNKKENEKVRNRKEMDDKVGCEKCLSKSEPTHWPSPTFDSKSAKRAIESFAKLLGKAKREIAGITVLEEGQEEGTPTRFWLRKYYRRLG